MKRENFTTNGIFTYCLARVRLLFFSRTLFAILINMFESPELLRPEQKVSELYINSFYLQAVYIFVRLIEIYFYQTWE